MNSTLLFFENRKNFLFVNGLQSSNMNFILEEGLQREGEKF
jgi:hypothetical protein